VYDSPAPNGSVLRLGGFVRDPFDVAGFVKGLAF